MKRNIRMFFGLILAFVFFVAAPATKAYAGGEINDCFDFGETTIAIAAGDTHKMWMRATYDYTYFITGATSDATYLETDFKSGSKDVIFHIGADEQGGNVFFHFYVRDDRLQNEDKHDCIEVYVQNRANMVPNLQVPLAGGKVGNLVQQGKISMLYSDQGVPMASFSLTYGDGNMASYGLSYLADNGAKYFAVTTGYGYAAPVISPSDKAVMQANGIAGVVVNGNYRNWP